MGAVSDLDDLPARLDYRRVMRRGCGRAKHCIRLKGAVELIGCSDPKIGIELMTAPLVYRLRTELLCVDKETRRIVLLEPGRLVTYVSEGPQRMVLLRCDGREILAFVVDFEDRAQPALVANA
jgi:hypothetical protein